MNSRLYAPPLLSLRFIAVWRRHFLVWRKLALPSILGNLGSEKVKGRQRRQLLILLRAKIIIPDEEERRRFE